jgi:DNA-binding transcriptional regulator YhcF (GntR family)
LGSQNIFSFIAIDADSITPRYLQLSNSVLKAVREKKIGKGYLLPSINDMSYEMEVSRDTVERAYKHLKKLGIIQSVHGKGYFISHDELEPQQHIFLLFNKLSAHKKIVYDSFVSSLGDTALIDFYIYNNNYSLFKKLLMNKWDEYSHYVIMPHFLEGGEYAHELINRIPKDKLVLMSKLLPGIEGNYAAVYENYEKDIYNALAQALDKLKKYDSITIVFPEYTYHPKEILTGFIHFCQDYAFNYEVSSSTEKLKIRSGMVYISLMENDLVDLIRAILQSGMKVGKDVGVISYNDTPLKQIILDGITTISSDFQMMGEKAAELITKNLKQHIAIPFYLTLRNSL